MKILLDTNIIIHREANRVVKNEIGILFNWLDKLHYTKCVHPLTSREIDKNPNKDTVKTMQIKLANYYSLKTEAPLHDDVRVVADKFDKNENDRNDTSLLNEVYNHRVDILITEDKKIHAKALELNISSRVFYINTFLEKVTEENPDLVNYKVLAVKKMHFGNVDLNDTFFDSFREDYIGFNEWFNRKSDEISYVCYDENNVTAFLFVKVENENEDYSNIQPLMEKRKRLKIGTLKVISNGLKIGERFLKIIFDNAVKNKVDEIYVTIFDKRPEQQRLIALLEEFGFKYHGEKQTQSGTERVYLRSLWPVANTQYPRLTYPKINPDTKIYVIPIRPEYHTELLPDSILNTESPLNFVENMPHRNAISKAYISHSYNRNLRSGDTIVFYRTGGIYEGVATTIGIVESIRDNISSADELAEICRKRTVLKPEELAEYWNRYPRNKPFVINFLYAFSFRRRVILKDMLDRKILPSMDSVRTISEMSKVGLRELVKIAGV